MGIKRRLAKNKFLLLTKFLAHLYRILIKMLIKPQNDFFLDVR
jgi:hypothetical protein